MPLPAECLRASAALLAAHIAVSNAIETEAISCTVKDPTIVDLLVRLDLAPDKRLRAVDLCDQLLKSPSHISRLLDRAEEAGLVRREADPEDRRASQVVLEKSGSAVVEEFAPRLLAVLGRTFFDALDEEETDTLVSLLNRVEQAARSAPPPD